MNVNILWGCFRVDDGEIRHVKTRWRSHGWTMFYSNITTIFVQFARRLRTEDYILQLESWAEEQGGGREVERRAGGGGGVGRGYAGRRCPCVTAQSCGGEQRSSVSVRSPGFHVRGHTVCEVLAGRRMMTMNGKQHFSMHPALHESKYPGLHSGSEGMRRVCLPAPQVRSGWGREWLYWVRGGEISHWKGL